VKKSLVKLQEEPNPRECYMLASWPGISNVSLLVSWYLRDHLQAREIGELDSASFFEPMGVEVKENVVEAPRFPQNKFYYWEDDKAETGLVLFQGEEQPASGGYELVNQVLDVAKKLKVKRVFSCAAGIARTYHRDQPRVWGVATEQKILEEMKEKGVVFRGDFRIAGLNGLFLGRARERGFEGACLLGEVPAYATQMANPRAAQVVLKALIRLLEIEVDLSEISELAGRMEEEMDRVTKEATVEFLDHFTEPIWEQGDDEEDEEDEE